MDSNIEITKSLFENECQRIVECKDNKTGDTLIYNTIINQKLIKLIDINILNSITSNIVKCYKTEDRLYIVTRIHDQNNQKMLKEYIDNNNLTLKQQFKITEQLINLFIQIYNVTDLLQFKIINIDNLSVGEDDTLYVNGYFEFKDEYDLSDNFTYKNIGRIIHYLFSKEEIVDYNISDTIPPDILKIIVKCLTREYFHPKDILKEFLNSPIYSIINCKTDVQVDRHSVSDLAALADTNTVMEIDNDIDEENINTDNEDNCAAEDYDTDYKDSIDNTENIDNINASYSDSLKDGDTDLVSKVEEETENLNIIDIYLNNVVNDDKNTDNDDIYEEGKSGKLLKVIIPVVVIAFVTIVSVLLIKSLYNKDKPVNNDNIQNVDNNANNKPDKDDDKETENKPDSQENNNSSKSALEDYDYKQFLNSELIGKIGYTGILAVADAENYNEGTASLLVENNSDETVRALFAVIDFTDDKLKYMIDNQIGIAAKFKSFEDIDAKLIVEAYSGEKLTANSSGKIQVFDDIWTQKDITINVHDIDRVNLYVEYSGKNKIWIDAITVDILK